MSRFSLFIGGLALLSGFPRAGGLLIALYVVIDVYLETRA